MQSNIPIRLLLCLAFLFSSFPIINTFSDVRSFGDIDLRDKIVGARLLQKGLSPYYYKWQPGDDERLLDPLDRQDMRVSRVTVPPSFLLVFVPLSELDHSVIQWIWFGFSYLCILLLLFQFHDLAPPGRKEYVWIAGLFFFVCTMAWQMHIERGQNYIFYTAVLSSVYWLYKKEKYLIAGIIFALLCWIRLPFLMGVSLLLLLAERRRLFSGFIAATLFFGIFSVVFTSGANWTDYFSSMQEWSRFEIHEMAMNSPLSVPEIPWRIEGETNLGSMRDFWQNNRSVQSLAGSLFDMKLNTIHLFGCFLAVLAGLTAFLIHQKKKGKFQPDTKAVFILIFLLYVLTEYFSPAPSYSYHYVQWIFPVLLCTSQGPIRINAASAMIFLGLAMNIGIMSLIPYNLVLGEAVLYAGMVGLISEGGK